MHVHDGKPIQSAEEFIQLFSKTPEAKNRDRGLLDNRIAFLFSPIVHIPSTVYRFGQRLISLLYPKVPMETGAQFITSEILGDVDLQLDAEPSVQLKKNLTKIFQVFGRFIKEHRLSILYRPAKYSCLDVSDAVGIYPNGQVIFTPAFANFIEEEALWIFAHEMCHYEGRDGLRKDLFSLTTGLISFSLYFDHSFFAFYISQLFFFGIKIFLNKRFELGADDFGVEVLGSREGAISALQKIVRKDILAVLLKSGLVDFYCSLPSKELLKVRRYLANNRGMSSDYFTHPSPFQRLEWLGEKV